MRSMMWRALCACPWVKALYHPVYHAQKHAALIGASLAGLVSTKPKFINEAAQKEHPWAKTSSTACPKPCINVVDHGAVGDGMTDNIAAITAAFAAAAGGLLRTNARPTLNLLLLFLRILILLLRAYI